MRYILLILAATTLITLGADAPEIKREEGLQYLVKAQKLGVGKDFSVQELRESLRVGMLPTEFNDALIGLVGWPKELVGEWLDAKQRGGECHIEQFAPDLTGVTLLFTLSPDSDLRLCLLTTWRRDATGIPRLEFAHCSVTVFSLKPYIQKLDPTAKTAEEW